MGWSAASAAAPSRGREVGVFSSIRATSPDSPGAPGTSSAGADVGARRPPPAVLRERVLPGEHPVEHHAEREDVGPLVLRRVQPLLRRHVGRRPAGEAPAPEGVGHPEVEDLHQAPVGHEDVRGLEIPVHHPLGVGVGESPRHLHRDVHRLLHRERSVLHPLLERLPAQKLEDEVRTVLALPHVVERDQVGVGQPGDGLGLPDDLSLPHLRPPRSHHLQRDHAPEFPVPGLVDHTEAAPPQLAQDLEAPEDRPLRKLRQARPRAGSSTAATSRRRSVNAPGFKPPGEPLPSPAPAPTRTPSSPSGG